MSIRCVVMNFHEIEKLETNSLGFGKTLAMAFSILGKGNHCKTRWTMGMDHLEEDKSE